jgi:hypothetical protein
MNGTATVIPKVARENASEICARFQPNSWLKGLRNTPKVGTIMGPKCMASPIPDTTTIHQP